MREGWTYKKLGEVATFKRGLTYSGKDEVTFSDNVVLRSNNIDLATNTLNLDELKYISSDIIIPEDKKLKANSIFMCMSNGSKQHLGKVAFIDQDMPYAFGGFMGLIIPQKEKIYPKYLYFYFCSPQFKDVLSSIGNGANINNIKFVDIAKYSVKTPSLSEQQSIVAELDKINELISLKKAQLSDLDSLAQSIFYDMFGDPIENEKGWEVKKLGNLCNKIGSGATPRGGNESYKNHGISLIRSMNVYNNEFRYKDLAFIDEEQADALSNVVVSQQDILLNITGASVARCCIVPDNILPARVNQHVCIIRPKSIADSIYLNYMLTNDSYQNHLLSLARSKAATREALPKSIVEDLHIPLPPLPLQQEFAKRIELIEQQKAQISSTIKDLETLLASRMQYWFD